MNRRDFLRTTGAGALTGGLAAVAVAAVVPASGASLVSADLAAAIEAHRAAILHDETLYGDDYEPIVDAATFEASDAEIAAALAALAAVPCRTLDDAARKAQYILGGSIGMRADGWADEFLSLLIPDGADWTSPATPMALFLRSLLPPDAHA